MTQEGRPGAKKLENPLDQGMLDFGHFVDEHSYTADQMREAYYRLVGIHDEKEPTPEVAAILGEMRKMVEQGFPLNRFARLVEGKQSFEDAVPAFHTYIETLDISANEKRVLNSIIDKERSGEVACLIGGETVAEFEIDFKGLEKAVAAILLLKNIKEITESIPKGKKYEFTFSEN